jgi:Flp pilus assembly pilin Flp
MSWITRRISRTIGQRRSWRALLDCRAGTFAVEFGLIAPFLLVLLVAVGDLSLMLYRKMEIQNAARMATQYGTLRRPVQGDVTAIEAAARSNLPQSWFADGSAEPATVSASLSCSCDGGVSISCNNVCPAPEIRATYLNVDITKTQPTIFDYPLLPDRIVLVSRSSVRLQ